MDINVNVQAFEQFLKRCYLGGLIKDLTIHANNDTIFAKFTDTSQTMYGEVYCTQVKVKEEGSIRIADLGKLVKMIGQCESDLVRLKSSADAVAFTDGNAVGKMNVNLMQASDAELIESFDPIKDIPNIFDKDVLSYNDGETTFENGFKVSAGILDKIIKDGAAFGYEIFTMEIKKNTLKCKIENSNTSEKSTRVMSDSNPLGDISKIPSSCVGMGFKEMVKVIKDTCNKQEIHLYLDELAWCLTNNKEMFLVLNTIPEDD